MYSIINVYLSYKLVYRLQNFPEPVAEKALK